MRGSLHNSPDMEEPARKSPPKEPYSKAVTVIRKGPVLDSALGDFRRRTRIGKGGMPQKAEHLLDLTIGG